MFGPAATKRMADSLLAIANLPASLNYWRYLTTTLLKPRTEYRKSIPSYTISAHQNT